MEFKIEKNVPDVYVSESRDFQLLCRVLDIYLVGCLNRASNMKYQLDLDKCSENLLWAIANMQGFVTNVYIPPNVLRNICKVFPYCIKRKGTAEAIRVASYAVLSTDRLIYDIAVDVRRDEGGSQSYTLYVECETQSGYQSDYLQYLDEVLRFLVPAGWGIRYALLARTIVPVEDSSSYSDMFTRLSGITGRIMSELPLNYSASLSTLSTKTGMHSRVNSAKIIKSRSTDTLIQEQGILQGTSMINLIDTEDGSPTQGKTVFIGQNIEFEG